MVDGEFMQLRNAAETNLSELDYREAIMGKTGLLIAASCEIGALFAGASDSQREALKRYGVGIGCAFQMVDDLLDYTGNQEKTGKRVGNDLAEGKMTLPLIVTLARANAEDGQLLSAILQDQARREQQFSVVDGLINKYGGYAETRRKAETAVGEAVAALELFQDRDVAEVKGSLAALAGYILTREK